MRYSQAKHEDRLLLRQILELLHLTIRHNKMTAFKELAREYGKLKNRVETHDYKREDNLIASLTTGNASKTAHNRHREF